MGNLFEKVQDYERMLKQMENLVHGRHAQRVKDLLQKVGGSIMLQILYDGPRT